jgi:hypothetical protein
MYICIYIYIYKYFNIFIYIYACMYIGELDLWCTTEQLLDIGAGDEEEHAVMLYNMLYYLSLKDKGMYL